MSEVSDEVIERQPKPQSQFARWSTVILMVTILAVAGVVSALTAMGFAIRGRQVTTPQLVGKTQSEAEEMLRRLGLKLKVTSSRFSSDVTEGKVLEQIPSSGTRLKVDRT